MDADALPDVPELDVAAVSVIWGAEGIEVNFDEDRMSAPEAFGLLELGRLYMREQLMGFVTGGDDE